MKLPRWLRWRSHAEIDEEIDAHLELEVRTHLDRGLTMDEARGAARLALALFVGSTLMVRSFAALSAIDPGFDPSRVLTFRVAPGATSYPDGEPLARFYDVLLEQLRAIPGVTTAGAASLLPMTGGIGGLGGPWC